MPDPQDISPDDFFGSADHLKALAVQHGLRVSSEVRTPQHNRAVGGAPHSYHLTGNALDVTGDPASMKAYQDNVSQWRDKTPELLNEGDHIHVAFRGPGAKAAFVRQSAPPSDISPDDFFSQQSPAAYVPTPAQPAAQSSGLPAEGQPVSRATHVNSGLNTGWTGKQAAPVNVSPRARVAWGKHPVAPSGDVPVTMTGAGLMDSGVTRSATGGMNRVARPLTPTPQQAIAEAQKHPSVDPRVKRAGNAAGINAALKIAIPGLPDLPPLLTEALADVTSGAGGGVGEALKGMATPGPFNPAANLPGLSDVLQATAGKAGEYLTNQAALASEAGAPEGARKTLAHGAGALAPVLLARNPAAIGALTYTQAKGRGEGEAEAIKQGIVSAATVKAMGRVGDVAARAVPGAGLSDAVTRFGIRALGNVGIASTPPLVEQGIRTGQVPSASDVASTITREAPMGVGFAMMPHGKAAEPSRFRSTEDVNTHLARLPDEERTAFFEAMNGDPSTAQAFKKAEDYQASPSFQVAKGDVLFERAQAAKTAFANRYFAATDKAPRVTGYATPKGMATAVASETVNPRAGAKARFDYESQRAVEERPKAVKVEPTEAGVETGVESGLNYTRPGLPRLVKRGGANVDTGMVRSGSVLPAELSEGVRAAPEAPEVTHHSQVQSRADDGTFNGPPSEAYTPKAEVGYRLPGETVESYYNRLMPMTDPSRRVSFDEFKREYDEAIATSGTAEQAGRFRSPIVKAAAGIEPSAAVSVNPQPIEAGVASTEVAPVFSPGDRIAHGERGTKYQVEKANENGIFARAIGRDGKASGRPQFIKTSDLRHFAPMKAEPITVRQAKANVSKINPQKDTLLSAIAKIRFSNKTQEGRDLAAYFSRPGSVDNSRLPNGERRGIDNHLLPSLAEAGWHYDDVSSLLEAVRREQNGKPSYSDAHDHGVRAESELRLQLAKEHTGPVKSEVTSFISAYRKHSEFAALSDKIANQEATTDEVKRFAEIGRYELNVNPDSLESYIEESASLSRPQERGAESGVEAAGQDNGETQRSQRAAGEQEGDVNVEPDKSAYAGKTISTGAGSVAVSAMEQPASDQLAHVRSILDSLKDRSKETGQSLSSLVEDRINQQSLPGMESAQLSTAAASLLRQMAAKRASRAPVAEKQGDLLETAPTPESKQADAKAAEGKSAAALSNAPLFQGVKAEPVTDKQLMALKALANSRGVDLQKERGVDVETLSKQDASKLIDELKGGKIAQMSHLDKPEVEREGGGTGNAQTQSVLKQTRAINEQGEPLTLYHGSSTGARESFEKAYQDEGAHYGPGFYFTDSRDVAESYHQKDAGIPSHAGTTAVNLDIRRPFDVDSPDSIAFVKEYAKEHGFDLDEFDNDVAVAKEKGELDAYRLLEEYVAAIEPEDNSDIGRLRKWVNVELSNYGYDGIKHTGGKGATEHSVWITFEPEQVKVVKEPASSESSQTAKMPSGGFSLVSPKVEPEKGEHGQFINALFKSPDADAQIPSFWANPEVRAKLNLSRTGPMAETKDALAKELGKPRSSHLTPDDIRGWAQENGLGKDATQALDVAESQYRARLARIAEMKKTQGGFLRFGGKSATDEQIGLFDDVKQQVGDEAKARSITDFIIKARRAILLSSVKTIGKLGAAATGRIGITPIEEGIGSVIRQIPGIKQIATKAPREGGGFELNAERAAMKGVFSKQTWADMKQTAKTGASSLDVMYGGKDVDTSPEAIEFFGRLHGAMKTPAKRAEFYRSMTKFAQAARLAAINKGITDVDDYMQRPDVQAAIGAKSYQEAQRAIFMNDNGMTEAYKMLRQYAESKGAMGKIASKTMQFFLPVVKVPTNYVMEASSYGIGAAKALGQVISAKGISSLTPEQADYVMRNLKKQTLGTAMMALGYFGASSIGGYYQEGEKRAKGEPEAGGMQVFGVDVPKFLLHTPALEALQIGATLRRVMDKQDSLTSGVAASGKGLVSEIPFFSEPARLAKAAKDSDSAAKFAGETVRSLVVPPDVQNIARMTDEEGVRRHPKGFTDEIKMGIPGLRQQVEGSVPVERTAGEQRVHGAANKMFGSDHPPMTDPERERYQSKQEIIRLVRAGKTDEAEAKAKALLDAGKVSERELQMVGKRATMTNLQYDMSRLSLRDALDLYYDGGLSDTERKAVRTGLFDKMMKFDPATLRGEDLPKLKERAMQFAKDNKDLLTASERAELGVR